MNPESPLPPTPGAASQGDHAQDPIFEALWSRVLDAWDEDAPHSALLDYAIQAQKLPEVAARYRALQEDPMRGTRAKKRLDGVVLAATQLLFSMKTPPRVKPPWQMTATVGVLCVVALTVLYRLMIGR